MRVKVSSLWWHLHCCIICWECGFKDNALLCMRCQALHHMHSYARCRDICLHCLCFASRDWPTLCDTAWIWVYIPPFVLTFGWNDDWYASRDLPGIGICARARPAAFYIVDPWRLWRLSWMWIVSPSLDPFNWFLFSTCQAYLGRCQKARRNNICITFLSVFLRVARIGSCFLWRWRVPPQRKGPACHRTSAVPTNGGLPLWYYLSPYHCCMHVYMPRVGTEARLDCVG